MLDLYWEKTNKSNIGVFGLLKLTWDKAWDDTNPVADPNWDRRYVTQSSLASAFIVLSVLSIILPILVIVLAFTAGNAFLGNGNLSAFIISIPINGVMLFVTRAVIDSLGEVAMSYKLREKELAAVCMAVIVTILCMVYPLAIGVYNIGNHELGLGIGYILAVLPYTYRVLFGTPHFNMDTFFADRDPLNDEHFNDEAKQEYDTTKDDMLEPIKNTDTHVGDSIPTVASESDLDRQSVAAFDFSNSDLSLLPNDLSKAIRKIEKKSRKILAKTNDQSIISTVEQYIRGVDTSIRSYVELERSGVNSKSVQQAKREIENTVSRIPGHLELMMERIWNDIGEKAVVQAQELEILMAQDEMLYGKRDS